MATLNLHKTSKEENREIDSRSSGLKQCIQKKKDPGSSNPIRSFAGLRGPQINTKLAMQHFRTIAERTLKIFNK